MQQNLQKTIKDSIQLEGVGLHNGIKVNISLKPAEANSGIKFKRTDVEDSKNIIEASYKNVGSAKLCTKIENSYGISVRILDCDGYEDVGEMTKEVFFDRLSSAKKFGNDDRLLNLISSIKSGSLI